MDTQSDRSEDGGERVNTYEVSKYTTGDEVTSLFYAAGVAEIFRQSFRLPVDQMYLGFLLLLFIFLDWLSRVGVPTRFPELKDQTNRRLPRYLILKAILEIAVIYTFCYASVHIFLPAEGASQGFVFESTLIESFSAFLLLSLVWNVLTLKVMSKLKLGELLNASLFGSVFDLEAAKIYTKSFLERIKKLERSCKDANDPKSTIRVSDKLRFAYSVEGFARTGAQLLGIHITLTNVLVPILLIFNKQLTPIFYPTNGFLGMVLNSWILALVLLIVLPTVLFFLSKGREGEDQSNSSSALALRRAASFLTVLLFMRFYLLFDPTELIIAVLVEHAVSDVFLQFATNGGSTSGQPVGNPSDTGETQIS